MKRDEIFDALVDSDLAPEAARPELGRTLPFTKASTPLEEIYRLSLDAERPAELILKSARAGADELAAAMRALDGKPYRGFALLYAAQKGASLIGIDPQKALALAHSVEEESASLVDANGESCTSVPAPRQAILAEALLLRARSVLLVGDAPASRAAVVRARKLFAEAGDLGFGAALCDYHEGEAASFERDYGRAEQLIGRALLVFSEFGQEHLAAKAEAALGSSFGARGEHAQALLHLDRAINRFDIAEDARPLAMALNNKASVLAQLGRFDEARAHYARALNLALRCELIVNVRFIRTGLAELDFLRGQYARALRAFREIAAESSANGSSTDALFARLYAAECLGRTGQLNAMAAEVEALRHDRKQTVFSPSPALGELFVCLDQGTIDADLVAHVREYLQEEENGVETAYRPLRLVG
ncbi:MAG: tetratricopeptide repeat protein [Thermoanaerobaculia bacterium]